MNLLGKLFLLTIREDISVPREEFITKWNDIGLPKDLIPNPRSLEDTFRKAVPRKVVRDNMTFLDYKGQAQLQQFPDAKMKMVLVQVEPRKEVVSISAANAAVIFLNKDACETVPLRPLLDKEQKYLKECKQAFYDRINTVDGSQARAALQKVFARCSTLAYRDGAYLIPAKHFETANKIEEMILFLQQYSTTPSVIKVIDYVDVPHHREDLIASLQTHIEDTAEYCYTEARKIKPEQKQKRKHTRGDTLIAHLSELSSTITVYEQLMDIQLLSLRQNLATAKTKLLGEIAKV